MILEETNIFQNSNRKKEYAGVITVKEIAQICSVSPSTVSNILNGKSNVSEQTRQRVLQVVKETGYQPNYFAQSMRKQNSCMISIITEDLNEFSTSPIVEAIMAYCEDHEYRTILMNLRLYDKWQDTWYNDAEKLRKALDPAIQEALSIRVDGLIYVAGHCRHIDCFPPDIAIPAVCAYGIAKSKKHPSIVIDDEKGGYDMTKYLIDKGHKKIGAIGGAQDNFHTQNRMLGYQKALFEGNALYNPEWVCYGNWKRQSGYLAAKKLIDQGVTAIFCMNDNMAAGVYDYLYEQGMSVGKDLSVVGYDNKEISAYLRPKLTTNAIQLSEIGRKTAEIMVELLDEKSEGKAPAGLYKIPCRVMERDSVHALN